MPVRTLLEGHSVGNGVFRDRHLPKAIHALGRLTSSKPLGANPSPGPKSPSLGQRLSGAPPRPAPTHWRRRSRRRHDVGRSIDSTFGALWPRSGLHQFPRCPDQAQSPRPRVQASAAGLARSDESCPTNNPSAEGAFAPTSTRSRSDLAASDVTVDRCSICPQMCPLRGGMCPLLPTKCPLFLVPRSYAPHPVDPCCRTLHGPSAYLFRGSRPPPTGRARHPGRETPGRIFQYPPRRRWPYPVRGEPTGSLRTVVSNHKAPTPNSPERSSAQYRADPTPFVVSRPESFGGARRTTKPAAPNLPSDPRRTPPSPPVRGEPGRRTRRPVSNHTGHGTQASEPLFGQESCRAHLVRGDLERSTRRACPKTAEWAESNHSLQQPRPRPVSHSLRCAATG